MARLYVTTTMPRPSSVRAQSAPCSRSRPKADATDLGACCRTAPSPRAIQAHPAIAGSHLRGMGIKKGNSRVLVARFTALLPWAHPADTAPPCPTESDTTVSSLEPPEVYHSSFRDSTTKERGKGWDENSEVHHYSSSDDCRSSKCVVNSLSLIMLESSPRDEAASPGPGPHAPNQRKRLTDPVESIYPQPMNQEQEASRQRSASTGAAWHDPPTRCSPPARPRSSSRPPAVLLAMGDELARGGGAAIRGRSSTDRPRPRLLTLQPGSSARPSRSRCTSAAHSASRSMLPMLPPSCC